MRSPIDFKSGYYGYTHRRFVVVGKLRNKEMSKMQSKTSPLGLTPREQYSYTQEWTHPLIR
jgi:hypothetical protein